MDSKSNFFILFTESCLTVPHNSTAKFKFYGLSGDREEIPLKSYYPNQDPQSYSDVSEPLKDS